MNSKVTVTEAVERLKKEKGQLFTILMQHGSMKVEYYAPQIEDLQTRHTQDELYVIVSGSGTFYNDGIRTSFAAHDVLFVPAGIEHRFENFTDDFATWVIFYGPQNGEAT